MGTPESPPPRRTRRNVMAWAAILALVAVWLAWARPSAHLSPRASLDPSPTSNSPAAEGSFTIGNIRESGHIGPMTAYRVAGGSLCVDLPNQGASYGVNNGTTFCDFLPPPGQAVHLAYARWLYLDSACCGFGVFVIGSISPQVASVRVGLGGGRWVNATLLVLPSQLDFPYRLFYVEKRLRPQSLDRNLPVVALSGQGLEIGRTSYMVRGG